MKRLVFKRTVKAEIKVQILENWQDTQEKAVPTAKDNYVDESVE